MSLFTDVNLYVNAPGTNIKALNFISNHFQYEDLLKEGKLELKII